MKIKPADVLLAVLKYGPAVVPLISDIVTMINSNKTEVTAEDFARLVELGSKKAADYLADAQAAQQAVA